MSAHCEASVPGSDGQAALEKEFRRAAREGRPAERHVPNLGRDLEGHAAPAVHRVQHMVGEVQEPHVRPERFPQGLHERDRGVEGHLRVPDGREKEQAGRLGIGAGSKRVDDCEYCHAFDHDKAAIAEVLDAVEKALEKAAKGFWQRWLGRVEGVPDWQLPTFMREASPAYVKGMLAYVKDRLGALAHDEEADKAARRFIAAMEEGDKCWLPRIERYSAHFLLKTNQRDHYESMVHMPFDGCLYILLDMQESLCFPTE